MSSPTVEQLIADFRVSAIAKGGAGGENDHRLYDRMSDAYQRLQQLGPDGVDSFNSLIDDTDPNVRSWVAASLLADGDTQAIPTLEHIAALPGIIGFNAKMVLQEHEHGRLGHPFQTNKRA